MNIDDLRISAMGLLSWANQRDPNAIMTTAFGLNGMALIHLAYQECGLRLPVVFVDTGFMFPETLALRDIITETYNLDLVQVEPVTGCLARPASEECCQRCKVGPMRAVIARLDPGIIISARGRFQAVTRRTLPSIEWDADPVRCNPMADWPEDAVWQYITEREIPYNLLYDRGYTSIGCAPCTRKTEPGEDIRAGRWDGLGKVECGIWG